jgi:hypothetical protein
MPDSKLLFLKSGSREIELDRRAVGADLLDGFGDHLGPAPQLRRGFSKFFWIRSVGHAVLLIRR